MKIIIIIKLHGQNEESSFRNSLRRRSAFQRKRRMQHVRMRSSLLRFCQSARRQFRSRIFQGHYFQVLQELMFFKIDCKNRKLTVFPFTIEEGRIQVGEKTYPARRIASFDFSENFFDDSEWQIITNFIAQTHKYIFFLDFKK